MKLRINADLYENSCSNPECEQKAYAKKGIELTCSQCKKPMLAGQLFSASMVATKALTTVVAKSESQEVS